MVLVGSMILRVVAPSDMVSYPNEAWFRKVAEETRKSVTPPYVTYPSFKSFIKGLGETTVPSRIDKTVMSNYSGSTQYALHPALHWLGLVDSEDRPSDLLVKLSHANDPEFGEILDPVVRDKYSFLFADGFDLTSATSGQVAEAFRNQEASGSTVTKCISFFLRIAKEANIDVSPHVKPPTIKRRSSSQKPRKPDQAGDPPDTGRSKLRAIDENMEEFTIPIRDLPDGRLWLPKQLDEATATKALRIIKFNLEQYYDINVDGG